MDVTRKDLFILLLSLGVQFPRKTKLSDAELEKRLSKALDCAQYASRVVTSSSLDPSTHAAWNRSKPAGDAIYRHNWGEATQVHDHKMLGLGNPFPLYENPFTDLRQTMRGLAKVWDQGRDTFIIQDKEERSGISMRILEIREFDEETPILVVIYRHDLSSPTLETVQWLSHRMENHTDMGMVNITATLKEQQLLLRLLKQNSKRLTTSTYDPPGRDPTELPFMLSFLIPVGPLGPRELGSLSKNDGCSVCGELAKSKCSRCNAIRYCSQACQKDDWKNHRPTCTSLMGGTWRRLSFVPAKHPRPNTSAIYLNRFTTISRAGMDDQLNNLTEDHSVPNTHGGAAFVVKIQLNSHLVRGPGWPLTGEQDPEHDGTSMLIYDRQRAFEVSVQAGTGEAGVYGDVADVVRQKGYQRLKVFCWAIRTGEWTVDICVDQLPEWQNW